MKDTLQNALARLEGDASMAELVREAIHYYGDDKDGLARDIRIVLEHVKTLEVDAARINWLAEQHRRERKSYSDSDVATGGKKWPEDYTLLVHGDNGTITPVTADTFRAAIDAAMKSTP